MTNNRHNGIFYGVDGWTVLLYVLIVAGGMDRRSLRRRTTRARPTCFSFSHFYMKQLMWIGVAWVTAIVVLLLDERFYHMFAYPAYLGGIALLRGRAAVRPRGQRRQGVVRVRVAARAARRVRQDRHGPGPGPRDERLLLLDQPRRATCCKVGVVICIPLFIIILQNDTGSGIVLGSFLFVLYREGLNKWLCIPVLLIAALFIVSFLLSPMTLLVSLILVCTLSEAMMNGQWRSRLVYLAALALSAILLCIVMGLIAPGMHGSLPQPADRDARGRWSSLPVYAYRIEPDQHLHHGWDCSSVRWSSCPPPTISSIRFSNSTSATVS